MGKGGQYAQVSKGPRSKRFEDDGSGVQPVIVSS
jgi:hypothetical protein